MSAALGRSGSHCWHSTLGQPKEGIPGPPPVEAATTAPLWLGCRLLTNPGPLQGKLGREGLVAMVTSQEAVFITLSVFRGL